MKNGVILTKIGDIILIKVGKDKQHGFYARVNDLIADYKKGWWKLKFSPLVQTPDFKMIELEWKLDEDQIRGEEFTVDQVPHQIFGVEFLDSPDIYPDDPVPLPTSKKPILTLVK